MRSLDPDTHLSVRLGAIMCRNQYTDRPGPVIAQLRAMAGDRTDILAREVGMWVGFYDNPHTQRLRSALFEAFADLDLGPWVELGRRRAATRPHSTPGSA